MYIQQIDGCAAHKFSGALKTATVTTSNQTPSEAGGRWNFGKVVDLESIILRRGADRGLFGRDDWEADLGEVGWGFFWLL